MESLGKYRIVRPMKVGGSAAIYLAVMRGENHFLREVVIKRPLPHLVADPRARAMFVDEAHIVSRLAHSNVCQVLDLVARHDELYIVLEYLKGVDVREILRRCFETNRLIPPELAVYIASESASGLAYAHDAVDLDGAPLRLVHRDVSPKNIRVTTEGSVKVLDFGIAWASNRETETEVGTIKGTLGFMSPEQILGDTLDPRSDIFSFGIVLFQMLTGRNPFEGPTLKERVRRLTQTDAPLVSDYNAALDDDIQAIVSRCLERDPSQRYQHMKDVRADLDTYLSRLHVVSPRQRLADLLVSLFPDLREPDTDLQWVMTDAARSETAVDVTARLIFPEDADTKSELGLNLASDVAGKGHSSAPPMSPMTPMTTNERAAGSGAERTATAATESWRTPRVTANEIGAEPTGLERHLGVMTTAATSGPFEAFVSKRSSLRPGALVWAFVFVVAMSALFVVWRANDDTTQISAMSLAAPALDASRASDSSRRGLEVLPMDRDAGSGQRAADASSNASDDATRDAGAGADAAGPERDASAGEEARVESPSRPNVRRPHRNRDHDTKARATQRDLTPSRMYFRAAQRLDRAGRWPDAQTLYVLAYSRAGKNPDSAIYLNLGLLHDKRGSVAKAAACLRAYLARAPSPAQAGAIRTKLAGYGSVKTVACVDRSEVSAAHRKRLRQGPVIDQWIEEAKADALR
ncbi:MAG: protein kinase [Deltaproteobacteria bacterium]|nr:protein kinase [Deltaproteobacteria bacterium]